MKPPPASRTEGPQHPLMRDFQAMLARPGMMSFGAGFMNPAGFDVAGVRLSISNHSPASIEEGLGRLSQVLSDVGEALEAGA